MINKLITKDSESIYRLVNSVNYKINKNNELTGFLVYNFGKDNYSKRLKLNNEFSFGHFDGQKLTAFCLCYDSKFLQKNRALFKRESKILEAIHKYSRANRIVDFVWGDQIAVDLDSRRKKNATKLLDRLFCEMKKKKIENFFCMVAFYPTVNNAGIHLLIKNDFRFLFSIQDEEGKIWGILNKKIKFDD